MRTPWIRTTAAPLISLIWLAGASAEEPAPPRAGAEVVRDALDQSPAAPWEWVRPEAAGVRVAEGSLELRALPGTLWGKTNHARNQLVRPSPLPAGEPLTVEVTLTFAPEAQAEQAGLMIYFDDGNYVKVVREWLDGKRFLVMGVEKNDDGKAVAKVVEPSDTVTIRMTCRDRQVVAEARAAKDGEWKELGRCESPAESGGAGMKLAISAYGGPEGQGRWSRFSEFVVSRAGDPTDDVIRVLAETLRRQCPEAKIDVTDNGMVAKQGTMMFTLHGRYMTGEIRSQTHQEEGPNFKGFLLKISLHEGDYDGQAVVPQTLHGPYFPIFIDAPMTADGKRHYWVSFSYGSRLDEELKKAILGAIPRTKFESADQGDKE